MTRNDIPRSVILAAVRKFHEENGDLPHIALASKYPPKLVLSRMEQMVKEGSLQYGVSLATAWIVEGTADAAC